MCLTASTYGSQETRTHWVEGGALREGRMAEKMWMKIERRDWLEKVKQLWGNEGVGEKERCMEKSYGILLSCNPIRNITGRVLFGYFPNAVIKHHGQENLQKQEFIWAHSRGLDSMMTECRHGNRNRKFRDHISNHKNEAKRRKIEIV